MRIKIVLAGGLALVAVAALATLLHAPATVAATNGVQPSAMLVSAQSDAEACQTHETIPAGTTAVRLQIVATTGPRVAVEIQHAGHTITHGAQSAAWFGGTVTVPVDAVNHAVANATTCFQLRDLSGLVQAFGTPTRSAVAARANGKPLPGRVSITYLRPGRRSWLSLADGVIWHMELGHAIAGSLIVIMIAVLAATAIAIGAWTVTRELE
ncbi:MAG TPA: hypothetical protein VGI76_01340 [Solirubrobacteraceae bacterium]